MTVSLVVLVVVLSKWLERWWFHLNSTLYTFIPVYVFFFSSYPLFERNVCETFIGEICVEAFVASGITVFESFVKIAIESISAIKTRSSHNMIHTEQNTTHPYAHRPCAPEIKRATSVPGSVG